MAEALPLHPIVVHLPLALAILLPIASGALGYAIWKRRAPERGWAFLIAAHFALLASSGAAMLLGEADARRIQTRVDAADIEEHEGEGQRLVLGAGVAFVLALAGLLAGSPKQRRWAMAATFAAGLLCAALAIAAGHGGAVLVYRHGAAAAFCEPPP